jgi:VWFA-related protein
VDKPVQTQISAASPGDIRYRDRRLIILYFDMTAMGGAESMRAFSAAQKFIETQMDPSVLMAVMAFEGGAVRVKSDFTDDRARLDEVLLRLIYGDDLDGDGFPDNPETGTAFGQDDAEFNIFNTDRQLSALQTAMSMLRPLPERKTLVYFSSGLRLNGTDNHAQLRATTNAALRANVSIHAVETFSGRHADVHGPGRRQSRQQLSAHARHVVRVVQGHGRQCDVRLQRPVAWHRARRRVADELLHHRVLQHPHGARWTLPARSSVAHQRDGGRPGVPRRLLRRQDVREVVGGRQGTPA